MDWWSISVEARADGPAEVDDTALATLLELTQPYDGAVSADDDPASWTATIRLESAGPAEALAEATRLVVELALSAGLPVWPLARAEVVRDDLVDSD